MGIMRWTFYNELMEEYNNVSLTYGYKTKKIRIEHGLQKEHYIDARCISGNPQAKSDNIVYYMRKVRCHNRQLHKFNILKGGYRKNNQLPYLVKGYRLWDKVIYNNKECFITGRRQTGYFALKNLDGTLVYDSAKYTNLKLLETGKHYLKEVRKATPSAC